MQRNVISLSHRKGAHQLPPHRVVQSVKPGRQELAAMERGYPDAIRRLWRDCLAVLPRRGFVAILTYGSFPVGDFLYVRNGRRTCAVSDFEFIIVAEPDAENALRGKVLPAVLHFNQRRHHEQLGFSASVSVVTPTYLRTRLRQWPYFAVSLRSTGQVVRGNQNAISQLTRRMRTAPSMRDAVKLFEIQLDSLIVSLDADLATPIDSGRLYFSALMLKATCKMASVYALMRGAALPRLPDALQFARRTMKPAQLLPIESAFRLVDYIRSGRETSTARVANLLMRTMATAWSELRPHIERRRVGVPVTAKYILVRSLVTKVGSTGRPPRGDIEKLRVCLARELLATKGEHYGFYKWYYGRPEDSL